jgi:hypothetical protein
MSDRTNEPKEFDAVLGGEAPPPISGVVLGGIEGVKSRLKSSDFDVKVAALEDAINYGDVGLDLVIEALNDSSQKVQSFIERLLKNKGKEKGKQALLYFDPWLFFTKVEDWTREDFNPEVGIINPESKAYALNLQLDWEPIYVQVRAYIKSLPSKLNIFEEGHSFAIEKHRLDKEESNKKFQVFIDALGEKEIQALFCHYPSHSFINVFVEKKHHFQNLKVLFWGDAEDHPYKKTCRHKLTRNMSLILEAYPNLEVIHIRGRADGDSYDPSGSCLSFAPVRHENLKTLIVETRYLPQSTAEEIIKLDLPNLEYLELWTGNAKFDASSLIPIISDKFPKLKYLGIRSCENANEVAMVIVNYSLIQRLKVLDMSMGTMTNEGLEYLLNCPVVNQLHTLDISMNFISNAEVINQLECRVITQPQDGNYGERYISLYE